MSLSPLLAKYGRDMEKTYGEFGLAVSRGVESLVAEAPHLRWKAPIGNSGEPGRHEHIAQLVLAIAPQTPGAAMGPSIASPLYNASRSASADAAPRHPRRHWAQ